MKHQILVLSLLACMSAGNIVQADVDQDKSCSFSSCCKEKKCAPKPISKPTTITKSGCYCLTQDICGQITIAADNVTLDLNCHEVNGNGADAAIAADGYYNVTVKNGTVSNFLVVKNRGLGVPPNRCGVAIANGTDIELHDLNVISTDPIGMALTNCVGINISGCDFSGNDQALLLSGCRNGKISCCAAYDNINTNEALSSSAVVSCEFCDCIEFADVDVCNNTKNVPTGGFDPRDGIFTAAFSSNVNLERCKVNGNGTDLPFILRMNLTYFFASNNCTVTDCQANNNSIQEGSIDGISALFSPGCAIRRSQANGNSTANEVLMKNLSSILLFGSPNFVIKDCQANENFSGETNGIANVLSDNGQIVNCQANNNNGSGVVIGIVAVASNNTSITGCQANNNSSSEIIGLGISALDNVGTIIENCEANNNSSGAASNTPFFAAGIEIDSFTGSKDIRIINCVANGTRSSVDAFGILLNDFPISASNVVIKCCQCCDIVNSSTVSSSVAAGIGVRGGNDVSIQDCQVYDARAAGNGSAAGILVKNTVRCTIEGSEAFNSTAANSVGDGIILKGSTNNSTVRDCATIGNQDSGFADIGANDNFFAGNYAEANGTDYNNVTAVAVVFNKSAGSFSATPNRWSNIQAVI